ncbi:MAG: hypothetical protein JRJ56_06205 [Deltaproteobacteria bacterium]|nr:hypothetical protein [Deltaproteobacteria bacterium]
MGKKITGLICGLVLLAAAATAGAALVTIGTATYDGDNHDYNLIWDSDNNGNSVVWLDIYHYPTEAKDWASQKAWAESIGQHLTYNWNPGVVVDWGTNDWRLPSIGTVTSTGCNQTGSELGHLYYLELLDAEGNHLICNNNTQRGDLNATNFDHLAHGFYWTDNGKPTYTWDSWGFNNNTGKHETVPGMWGGFVLPIRTVESVDIAPVPVPGALWLLGSGLLGLVAIRRR